MLFVLRYAAGVFLALHGIAHLVGFVGSWPLAKLDGLPYRTTLLSGRWDVGPIGMKVVAVVWLVAALGFVISMGGYFANLPWWRPFLWLTLLVSTAIIALEWPRPIIGGYANAGILALLALTYLIPAMESPR